MCDRWVDVNKVHHNQPKYHFQHFYLMELNGKENMTWRIVWISIIWSIWRQRNTMIFKQG